MTLKITRHGTQPGFSKHNELIEALEGWLAMIDAFDAIHQTMPRVPQCPRQAVFRGRDKINPGFSL